MKAKSIIKRVLSTVLVMVMLFSCWVFTAPTANAATEPSVNYDVRITWVLTDSGWYVNGGYSYNNSKRESDDGWNTSGITLFHKPNNGTGTQTHSDYDIGSDKKLEGDENKNNYAVFENVGFPTKVYQYLDRGGAGAAAWEIRMIEVKCHSNDDSKYTTLWSGTMHCASSTQMRWTWLSFDGHCLGTDYTEAYIKNSSGVQRAPTIQTKKNFWGKITQQGNENQELTGGETWALPYFEKVSSVSSNNYSWSSANLNVTKDSDVFPMTYNSWAEDQYGAKLSGATMTSTITSYKGVSTVTTANPNGVTEVDDIKIESTTGKISSCDTGYKADGSASHKIYTRVKYTYNNVTKQLGSSDDYVSIAYPKYTVTYNYRTTKAAAISVSGSDAADKIYYPIENSYNSPTVTKTVLYGDTAPLPSNSEFSSHYYYLNGDNGHYWGGSFTAPTSVKADQTVNISYSSVPDSNAYKHNWGSWANYTGTSDNMSGDTYHRSTCSKQGDTHYRYQKHVYNQTTVHDSTTELVAPTCTAGGRYVKTCVCGKVDPTFDKNNPNTTSSGTNASAYVPTSGDGAALGHNWTTETVAANRLYQAATCLKPAKYYYSCSRCGISEENDNHTFENGTGTGHSFIADSWQQITAEEGYETYQGTTYNASEYHKHSCITAGCSLDDDVDINEKYRTDYDTHNWEKSDGKIKWYDNEDGTQCYQKCDDCGYKLYASHTYTSVTTQPTCTDDGFITHTCNTCGYIHIEYPYTESGNEDYKALGHKLDGVALSSDAEGHYTVCARCNENIKSDGTIGKDAHTPASAVRENEVAAGCTADGRYDSVIYCSNPDCHYEISRTPTVIPALGHDFTVKTVRDETTEKVAPTCLAPGQYYYTCSRCETVSDSLSYIVDDDGVGKQLEHNWVQHVVEPEDAQNGKSGFVYFACPNGCGQYKAGDYNDDKGKYEEVGNAVSSISSAESSSQKTPAPYFNDSQTYESIYNSFDYSKRLASIKYMSPSETGSQTMRYAGSVKIPEGIGITNTNNDNNIIDFGFVYTQESFILDENKKPDPDKLVFCEDEFYNSVRKTNYDNPNEKGYRVYKMSLAENNASSTNIKNWTGCTPQISGNETEPDYLSFNLVINIKAKNWHVVYVARPYVTYKYHNETYTVYDGGASSASEESSYYHRSVCSFTDSVMSYAYYLTTEGEYEDEYGSYGEYATLVDDAVGEMSYEDYCAGVSGVIRDKKYMEERIIGYLDSSECTLTEEQKTNIKKEFKNKDNWLYYAEAQDFIDNELKSLYGI